MKVAGVVLDSIVDGLGVRMTVFTQGCPHHCKGCHNPNTWDYDADCSEVSVQKLLDIFDSDTILHGVTFSGGEPFSERNLVEIAELVKAIKARGKTVWIYTGYVLEEAIAKYPEIKDTILPYTDVIVDGRFDETQRSYLKRFRGSSNQRLISVAKFLNNECLYTFE